ncbi:hypothetical protein, partial [uncultured Gemmiger sp.]|uniref:hypothetical protein n=1 Tax=uncultured Gemmiger sp. TaxID=1623490 RepID=UPI0027E1B64A
VAAAQRTRFSTKVRPLLPFIQRILYLFSSKSARENMGFILPWSLFWRWGKYAPCGLLANFRADTSIASQHRLFFKKEKDLHFHELSQNLQVLWR